MVNRAPGRAILQPVLWAASSQLECGWSLQAVATFQAPLWQEELPQQPACLDVPAAPQRDRLQADLSSLYTWLWQDSPPPPLPLNITSSLSGLRLSIAVEISTLGTCCLPPTRLAGLPTSPTPLLQAHCSFPNHSLPAPSSCLRVQYGFWVLILP